MTGLLAFLKNPVVSHAAIVFVVALLGQPLIQALLLGQPANFSLSALGATLLAATTAVVKKYLPAPEKPSTAAPTAQKE